MLSFKFPKYKKVIIVVCKITYSVIWFNSLRNRPKACKSGQYVVITCLNTPSKSSIIIKVANLGLCHDLPYTCQKNISDINVHIAWLRPTDLAIVVGIWCMVVHLLNYMKTSSSGNLFRVTGPLCGEFTRYRWIPLTKSSDAELWCFLWSAPE